MQLGLVVVYSITAYHAAEAKAARNRDMMTAMLSEWGRITAAANSYERKQPISAALRLALDMRAASTAATSARDRTALKG